MQPRKFSEFVRTRRKQLGLTQKELAESLGLQDEALIRKLERGTYIPTTHALMQAIARELKTDVKAVVFMVESDLSGANEVLFRDDSIDAAFLSSIQNSVQSITKELPNYE